MINQLYFKVTATSFKKEKPSYWSAQNQNRTSCVNK